MRFFRQEYWSGWPFPSPGDLPNPGMEPRFPALRADSLLSELWGKTSVQLRTTICHLPKHIKNEKAKGPCDQSDHSLMMRTESFCYPSSSDPQLSLLSSLDACQNLDSFTHVTSIYWLCILGDALNQVLGQQSLRKGEKKSHGLDLISCRRHV